MVDSDKLKSDAKLMAINDSFEDNKPPASKK